MEKGECFKLVSKVDNSNEQYLYNELKQLAEDTRKPDVCYLLENTLVSMALTRYEMCKVEGRDDISFNAEDFLSETNESENRKENLDIVESLTPIILKQQQIDRKFFVQVKTGENSQFSDTSDKWAKCVNKANGENYDLGSSTLNDNQNKIISKIIYDGIEPTLFYVTLCESKRKQNIEIDKIYKTSPMIHDFSFKDNCSDDSVIKDVLAYSEKSQELLRELIEKGKEKTNGKHQYLNLTACLDDIQKSKFQQQITIQQRQQDDMER